MTYSESIEKVVKINRNLSFWICQKSALKQCWFLAWKIFVFSLVQRWIRVVQRFSGNEQRWIRAEAFLNQSWLALTVSETSTRESNWPDVLSQIWYQNSVDDFLSITSKKLFAEKTDFYAVYMFSFCQLSISFFQKIESLNFFSFYFSSAFQPLEEVYLMGSVQKRNRHHGNVFLNKNKIFNIIKKSGKRRYLLLKSGNRRYFSTKRRYLAANFRLSGHFLPFSSTYARASYKKWQTKVWFGKTAKHFHQKLFSTTQVWTSEFQCQFFRIQKLPALTSTASVLIQRCTISESFWKALLQLWSMLKNRFSLRQNQSWTALFQRQFPLKQC